MGRPASTARCRTGGTVATILILAMPIPGPVLAAPTPVTTVSANELGKAPFSRDLKTILDQHNVARAGVNAAPLQWDPALAAQAAAYGPELARYGRPVHASRVGRESVRENLLQALPGTSAAKMIGVWLAERRNFVPGTFPNVSRTGNWADVGHYTQMVWPTTTRVGCAIHRGGQFDWLICRYSPPGNQDGRPVIAAPPARIALAPVININNPGGRPMLQEPPPNEDSGGGNNPGGTRERPRDVPTAPESFGHQVGECKVAIFARIRLVETGRESDEDRKRKEPYNLKHGFSEIVVPYGWDAIAILTPDADGTGKYTGRMRAIWGIADGENLKLYQISGSEAKLRAGIWDSKPGIDKIEPPRRPDRQTHRLWREWDPDDPTDPPQCEKEDRFAVTFAEQIDMPGAFSTKVFVDTMKKDGYSGTRPRTPTTTGTRSFHETTPRPKSRNNYVVVPIGIHWDLPDGCCDIPDPERKVIQFARAAIEGPTGRQGKDWGLDIHPDERERAQLNDAERARGERPTHDPTYTSQPRHNGNGELKQGSGGGIRTSGSDVEQWDAPGMPKDLFDRLFAAQGPSTYRQQFLSLLVCRPPGDRPTDHQTAFYLANGKVCQVAVTTVRWQFHGRAAARVVRRRGKPPQTVYDPPTITTSFDMRDGRCLDLRAFIQANGLVEAFERPRGDARDLENMESGPFGTLRDSVDTLETRPFNAGTGVRGIPAPR